tara:strand:- start:1515 stop:1814 length:300 start_codon:yes stop_codon:yes gene_type:complete
MTSKEMRDICITAIDAALVSRGKNKGTLKAKCPPMGTDGAAAWQAITAHANPYKMGIGHMLFFNERQQAIYDAIDKSLHGADVRHLDRDRVVLESLGVF